MADVWDAVARRAQEILALEQVPVVGILGLQDAYLGIFAGGVATGSVADSLGGDAMTEGVLGAAGIHAAREVNARAQGVTVRMVVAVSDRAIHLLSLPATGTRPGTELLRFDRATTTVQVKRFGLSRKVVLHDTGNGQKIGLTGSVAFFSSYAAGTRAVLAALTTPPS